MVYRWGFDEGCWEWTPDPYTWFRLPRTLNFPWRLGWCSRTFSICADTMAWACPWSHDVLQCGLLVLELNEFKHPWCYSFLTISPHAICMQLLTGAISDFKRKWDCCLITTNGIFGAILCPVLLSILASVTFLNTHTHVSFGRKWAIVYTVPSVFLI